MNRRLICRYSLPDVLVEDAVFGQPEHDLGAANRLADILAEMSVDDAGRGTDPIEQNLALRGDRTPVVGERPAVVGGGVGAKVRLRDPT